MIPDTTDDDQAKTLPYAIQWYNGKQEKISWHPGFRYHHFQGRKVALLVLKGLKEALQVLEGGIGMDRNDNVSFPLPEKYWHVGTMYETIRHNFKTNVNKSAASKSKSASKSASKPASKPAPHRGIPFDTSN
eukprot:scaffold494339_cov157-Attheya_sp.AAC.1